jgi:hypothetical protein
MLRKVFLKNKIVIKYSNITGFTGIDFLST